MVSSEASMDLQQLQNPVPDILFTDVTYSVPYNYNIFSKKKRLILNKVSGHFKSGEFSAIMGPSGAGKSSLLDIISGYRRHGYDGTVTISETDIIETKEKICYIMQEDNLQPHLTVIEVMNLSANLKIGYSQSIQFKTARVTKILDALGLKHKGNTLTGSLSGGERKRLAIALELVDNPPILYFDEPTTGLDSSSTSQCISLLKKLARDGRIVICTLHQPSASTFEMVDYIYCLADGRCCYAGSPKIMTNFLSLAGLDCPTYHNPADYLLEIISGEHGNHMKLLIDSSQNGKSHIWRKKDLELYSTYLTSQEDKSKRISLSTIFISNSENDIIVKTSEVSNRYNTSFSQQIILLVHRIFLTLIRDKFHVISRLASHLIIALLMGIFFYGIGNDAGRVLDNFNLLFFSAMFLAFSALQSMIVSFPQELPVIRREYFNNWYSVKAYYLANSIADFPIQGGSALIYCTIVYSMSNQPAEWDRFFMFLFMCTSVSFLAQSIGYLVGSSMRVINGVFFGPLFIMPQVMMSGFFLHMRDAPSWSVWVFKSSYLRHCLEGLSLAIYGYSRSNLPCISEDYCHFVTPKKFLKELDMSDADFLTSTYVLLGTFLFFKFITYFVLIYQIKNKR